MRVFVAAAGGVVGRQLVPALAARGHEVSGLTASVEGAQAASAQGCRAVAADLLDPASVERAITDARPEVVVQLSGAVPPAPNPRTIGRQFRTTNRIRAQGSGHLLAAASAAGVRHVVAESFAPAYVAGPGLADEDVPFIREGAFAANGDALVRLEEQVLGAGGTVLRFGHLYGPGSFYAPGGSSYDAVRKRRMPIAGDGGGAFSFLHAADAADAVVAAVERTPGGVYNVVDDDPAAPRDWLPEYAREIGAKPPRRVPAFLVRAGGGDYALHYLTAMRGASNARAKAGLGWQPGRPSWRGRLGDG